MYGTVFDKTGGKCRLDEISPDPPSHLGRAEGEARFQQLGEELFELQDALWGARTHAVLVILQGRDAAGKDGAIKNVAGWLNPRGVQVVSFGVPTKEESEHDFLWRVHRHAPRKGEVAIFNRSHYEDVLVVRVNNLVPESLWRERYDHINDFEELLVEHDTVVLKYFLHISKDEQKRRLLDREVDPKKAWKLNVNDWKDRERWDDYTEAYQVALSRCATARAPWVVVPSNAKWFRNLVIAESMVAALRPLKKTWKAELDRIEEQGRAEIQAYRQERGKG